MKRILIMALLITGCKQLVPDRTDVVTSGTTTIEITASLRIIDQLKTLCTEQLGPINYPTDKERQSAISDCVFSNLKNIGGPSSALTDFTSRYCGVGTNLTGLTQSQIDSINATCIALGK